MFAALELHMPAVRGESQGCKPQTVLASAVGKEGTGHESDGCLLNGSTSL